MNNINTVKDIIDLFEDKSKMIIDIYANNVSIWDKNYKIEWFYFLNSDSEFRLNDKSIPKFNYLNNFKKLMEELEEESLKTIYQMLLYHTKDNRIKKNLNRVPICVVTTKNISVNEHESKNMIFTTKDNYKIGFFTQIIDNIPYFGFWCRDINNDLLFSMRKKGKSVLIESFYNIYTLEQEEKIKEEKLTDEEKAIHNLFKD